MNTYTQMSTRGQSLMPDRCTHARRRKNTHANTQTLSYTHTHTHTQQSDGSLTCIAILWQGKRLQLKNALLCGKGSDCSESMICYVAREASVVEGCFEFQYISIETKSLIQIVS